MNVVIMGSGNVAWHLAKAFSQKNIPVVQLFGRNEKNLREMSAETGIPYSTQLLAEADLYLIAVSDSAIAEVSKLIPSSDALVAHTSGSVSRDTLLGNYRKSVFYPLQTFSRSKELQYSEIPFFVDAENKDDEKKLMKLAEKISDKVMPADDEKRKYIHLTAVFACNFVNHLYARAKEIADQHTIPFHYFLPLIEETTDKIYSVDPKNAQTGPAVRNDLSVMAFQEKLLSNEEQLKIYKTMNESIKKMYEL